MVGVHQNKRNEKPKRNNFKINSLALIRLMIKQNKKNQTIILLIIAPLKYNNKLLKNKTLLIILRNNKWIIERV